jgi:NAD+ kinase
VSSADALPIRRIGVVLHPKRDVSRTVDALREWATGHDADLVQVSRLPDGPVIAPDGDARDCALVVAIGGDGTVLAALRQASAVQRPVLGIACGSLGALTTVEGDALIDALDAFAAGDWEPKSIPALHVTDAAGATASAINDLVVVRAGGNQVSVEAEADGVLYGRWSGDGVIASTALGSSAYALAAGGPILAPGSGGWSITPLAAHGGCVPPLVLGARATGRLVISPGFAGARVEVDGRRVELDPHTLTIERRSGFGTLVSVGDEEPLLAGLRRRRIIIDSPRILARDARLEKARIEGST